MGFRWPFTEQLAHPVWRCFLITVDLFSKQGRMHWLAKLGTAVMLIARFLNDVQFANEALLQGTIPDQSTEPNLQVTPIGR
jgi:hypothetical protein